MSGGSHLCTLLSLHRHSAALGYCSSTKHLVELEPPWKYGTRARCPCAAALVSCSGWATPRGSSGSGWAGSIALGSGSRKMPLTSPASTNSGGATRLAPPAVQRTQQDDTSWARGVAESRRAERQVEEEAAGGDAGEEQRPHRSYCNWGGGGELATSALAGRRDRP